MFREGGEGGEGERREKGNSDTQLSQGDGGTRRAMIKCGMLGDGL